MKNLVFFSSLLIAVMFAFVSCGSDDPKDYTLKDLSVIAGTYTGQCVISPTGTTVNKDTTVTVTVQLVGNSTANTMQLQTDESGYGTNHGDVLSNFKSTTDDLAYTFDIKGFNFTRSNIPYINKWFSSYTNISDVAITVNASNDARYNKSTKTLTFSYTGTASFTATSPAGEANQKQSPGMKYTYTVVKQ